MRPVVTGVALAACLLACTPLLAQNPRTGGNDPEAEMEKIRRKVLKQGSVCPDPDRPCEGFKSNELSFRITTAFKFDRGKDESAPFYAVLLKTAPLCSIQEEERLKVQALFPRQKVFVHQYFCQDFGDKVTYTNVNAKVGFIAVYAGATVADANAALARITAMGMFPDANVRKMAAVVVYQLE